MPVADYLEGLAFALPTYGAVLFAALVLVRGRGVVRVVACGLVATAALVVVHLVPGALGVLSRGTVLVAALIAAAIAWRVGIARSYTPAPPDAARDPVAWGIAGAAVVASAAAALASLWVFAGVPITGLDTVTFHVPNVARWIQTGSLWQIDQFVPDQAHGYYPHSGDLVLLSAILPWRNDAFLRFVDLPFLALLGAAVYAIGVELRAPRPAAVLGAALLVAMPIVVRPAITHAMPDTVLLATFAAGVLFLLRGDLLLAGVGLGLAFGTKWYGVTCVAALLLVWAVARRPPVRDVARLSAIVVLFGGFWLLRNWVEGGNPVFPVEVPLLFDAPPDPIRAYAGASISDYLFDWPIVEAYLIPSWRTALSWGGPLLALAALAALRFARLRWLAVGVLAIAVVYVITPYTALGTPGRPTDAAVNVRYVVPGLVLAAALLAWLLGRLPRAVRLGASALMLLAILRTLSKAYEVGAARVAVAAVVLLAAGAAVWWLPRAGRTVLAVAVLAAAGVAAHDVQREHNAGPDPALGPVLFRVQSLAPGTRVGLASTWSTKGLSPVRAAFGERLDNEVEFVGPFVDGMLRRERSEAAFVRRADAFDVLVVGRREGGLVDEDRWLGRAGWRLLAQDDRLALYAPPAR